MRRYDSENNKKVVDIPSTQPQKFNHKFLFKLSDLFLPLKLYIALNFSAIINIMVLVNVPLQCFVICITCRGETI